MSPQPTPPPAAAKRLPPRAALLLLLLPIAACGEATDGDEVAACGDAPLMDLADGEVATFEVTDHRVSGRVRIDLEANTVEVEPCGEEGPPAARYTHARVEREGGEYTLSLCFDAACDQASRVDRLTAGPCHRRVLERTFLQNATAFSNGCYIEETAGSLTIDGDTLRWEAVTRYVLLTEPDACTFEALESHRAEQGCSLTEHVEASAR